jgi:hypothetical protein
MAESWIVPGELMELFAGVQLKRRLVVQIVRAITAGTGLQHRRESLSGC